MSTPVLTLPRDATVLAGARFLLEKRISGAPVVDARGKPTGVFTLRDLAKFFLQPWPDSHAKEADPGQVLVSELMTHRVVAVRPEATLGDLRKAMRSNHIHRLVVVEHGKAVGVVCASDLATRNL